MKGSVLDSLARGEALLNTCLESKPDQTPYDSYDPLSKNTSSTNVGAPGASTTTTDTPTIPYEQAQEIARFLNQALKDGDPPTGLTKYHTDQAQICLARLDLERNEPEQSKSRLRSVQMDFSQVPLEAGNYAKVALLMGWAVKGLAHLRLKEDNLAEEALGVGVKAIQSYVPTGGRSISSSLAAGNKRPDQDQWLRWAEVVLYQYSMLALRMGYKDKAMLAMKNYLRMLSPTPVEYCTTHKVSIIQQYFRQLLLTVSSTSPLTTLTPLSHWWNSPSYEQGNFTHTPMDPPPLSGIPPGRPFSRRLPSDIQEELHRYLSMYEKAVTYLLPFPRGCDMQPLEVERHQRVKRAYDWWVLLETCSSSDEQLGDRIERHTRLIQTLYRGTRHTFHSLRLLRYLSHTFCSLIALSGDTMCRNDKAEGLKVVESYVKLYEKHLKEAVDAEVKRRKEQRIVEERRMSRSGTTPVAAGAPPPAQPLSGGGEDEARTIAIEDVQGERVADAVGVLIAGVRMLLMTVEGEEEKVCIIFPAFLFVCQ
ncbi:hypothetical protein HK102_004244 [Quaeritorhiza haematococci]|nr:hypothetical protein HK102_004244 [Quaeritorhiza haematococci]